MPLSIMLLVCNLHLTRAYGPINASCHSERGEPSIGCYESAFHALGTGPVRTYYRGVGQHASWKSTSRNTSEDCL